MERSGVFLVSPTVQAHCRSPTGRSSTGSNAPRPYKWLGRRMQHATMGVIYTSGEIAIAMQPACGAGAWSLEHARAFVWLASDCLNSFALAKSAVKVLYSTVATAQLAVHTETESSGFGGKSIRQRAATFSLPDSVSKRAVVDKRSSLREESVKRYVQDLSEEFAHPKINVLHLPQHFSQFGARNTDDDSAKQQKRKIEYSSIRSLSHVHQFRTPCSNRRRKGQFSTRPRGTIAVLAQTNAIFSLHNRAAGRGPYISYGRNLWTCLNRPE